jgi:arginyl-tRNA synthetase
MEYSSPNMAKSMTIGHFRNTIIGQIMYNILQQTGCEHMNRNYVGDRGTAFGKFVTILHYKYKQDPSIIDDITNNPQAHMGVVYAEFKTCPREDKEEIARKIVTLMEAGNEVIMDLWRIIRELSLIDFTTVYDILNVHFDYNLGESFSVKLDNDIADDLKAKDILHESQ